MDPEAWVFETNGVKVTINAPSDLNTLNGRPHSISIGLYQIGDPATFTGLAATREGAVELMNKGKVDESIINYERISIQPGEKRSLWLNRAKGAQYIGVIVGYYKLSPKLDTHLLEIPVKVIEPGLVEKALAATSLVTADATAVPDKLYFQIVLGRGETKMVSKIQ